MKTEPLSESRYLDPDYQASRGWPSTALQQAEAGDLHAQLYMALLSSNNGPAATRSTTVRWYEMAADQGSLYAMILLSPIYETGDCGDVDIPKACDWMRKIVSMYDDAKNAVQKRQSGM
jgi:TPR repeat protein